MLALKGFSLRTRSDIMAAALARNLYHKYCNALQSQKAVISYLKSQQLLPSGFARQYSGAGIHNCLRKK